MSSAKLVSRNALSAFANLVYAKQDDLYRLWLISPWVSVRGEGAYAAEQLRAAVGRRRVTVFVVTRPPLMVYHSEAIRMLRSIPGTQVFYCAELHSKLYIAECNGFRGAVFGSPNLTPGGEVLNEELAVEFRTSSTARENAISALVDDLVRYATALRAQDNVKPAGD